MIHSLQEFKHRVSIAGTGAALALGLSVTPATAGLLAFYNFNGNAQDSSGNGRDATFVSATQGAGYEGQAYQFNGSSNYIRVPLNISASVLPQLTMGAWVWLDRASGPANHAGVQTFISHDNAGFDRTLNQDSRDGGNKFSAFTGSGVLGGAAVVTGQWVFVAARYDQVARTVVLNVDGNRYARSNVQEGAGVAFTDIGNNPSFVEYTQGRIDNVFFFDTVLSDAQLETIRLGGSAAILSAVPEPSAWMLGLLGLTALALRRRAA